MTNSKRQLPEEYRHDSPLGSEIRFNHNECGDTKARLYVVREPYGWKHHCHNCAPKMSGFTPDSTPSTSKTVERVRYAKELGVETAEDKTPLSLPLGYVTDIPIEGILWLYKYGLTDKEIEDYRIGYDTDSQRVILPWFNSDGVLECYQGRAVRNWSKCNPKYIHVGKSIFAELPNKECFRKVTVVEDLLSAIKVNRFTSAICLFGSFMSMPVYRHIGENYANVNIWLDHDKMPEAFKYAKRLRYTQDIPVKVIATKLDPKECEDRVIKAQTCYSSKGCTKLLEMKEKVENVTK